MSKFNLGDVVTGADSYASYIWPEPGKPLQICRVQDDLYTVIEWVKGRLYLSYAEERYLKLSISADYITADLRAAADDEGGGDA